MRQEKKICLRDIDVMVPEARRQHKILVYQPRLETLSYVNEWLAKAPSGNTAYQYAKIMMRFCNYLAENVYNTKENENMILEFWLYADTRTLKAWKTHRIMARNSSRKPDGSRVSSPSNGTIDDEANRVAEFLDWVKNDMLVGTLWDGGRKKIRSAKAVERWLRGIVGAKEIEVVDANTNVFFNDYDGDSEPIPVEALAKRKQSSPDEYLYDDQMKQLMDAFTDKVYACIALTGYLVGVRPHEVLAIPWLHMDPDLDRAFSGDVGYLQDCIRECPPEKRDALEIPLKIVGKGDKLRTVMFPAKGWLDIMSIWEDLRGERKKAYKKLYGKECPDWILWLTKKGEPLYYPPGEPTKDGEKAIAKLRDAFYNVSNRGKNPLKKIFHHTVDYYTMRHTFATNFVVRTMMDRSERDEKTYLEHIGMQKKLADQMGHEDFDTTLKHYIVNSLAIMLAHDKGERPREFFTVEKLVEHMAKKKKGKKPLKDENRPSDNS